MSHKFVKSALLIHCFAIRCLKLTAMALRIALLDHTTSSSGLICNYRFNWKIESCDFFAKFLRFNCQVCKTSASEFLVPGSNLSNTEVQIRFRRWRHEVRVKRTIFSPFCSSFGWHLLLKLSTQCADGFFPALFHKIFVTFAEEGDLVRRLQASWSKKASTERT